MEIGDLPDELVVKIFKYLNATDLKSINLTSKEFRRFTAVEEIWKSYCWRDYQIDENHLWTGWTFQDFYKKVLFPYSFLTGIFHRDDGLIGGMIRVKFEKEGIVGYECLPPLNDSYRKVARIVELVDVMDDSDYSREALHRLRARKIFVITPCRGEDEGAELQLRTIREPEHRCPLDYLVNRTTMKMGGREMKYKVLVDLWLAEDFSFYEIEYGFQIRDLALRQGFRRLLLDNDQVVYPLNKISGVQWSWFDLDQYRPLVIPRWIPDSIKCVNPGLYSGIYGRRAGWEIVRFEYNEDGTELIGTKISGDQNIPAGKITIRALLTKRLILTPQDLATFEGVTEAIDRSGASGDVGGQSNFPDDLQPFSIPLGCSHDRDAAEIPRFCRWFYAAEGQIAQSGYRNPEFTPCVFVGFEEDQFGVFWMKMKKLSMFYRANNTEDL